MNSSKQAYGLLGKSLSHSFSKTYFEKKSIENHWHSFTYENFEVSDLAIFFKEYAPKLNGFNVTIPYKEKVIPFLYQLDVHAQKIGAVNTVKVVNGKYYGYNTDWWGFVASLKPFLQKNHQNALILGTGGAAKAIAYGLEFLGIKHTSVSTHNTQALSYQNLTPETIHHNHLIINTTPLGMYPETNTMPAIPVQHLTPQHIVFDLIYNPEKTLLLKKAQEQNSKTLNGLNMLHLQAEKAIEIWQIY